MFPDYCVGVVSASPPIETTIQCYYWDGTEVVSGPPEAAECPPPYDERSPYCGGPCEPCPELSTCVGLSEERTFGVCLFEPRDGLWGLVADCDRGRPDYNRATIATCSDFYDEPCVCMTTTPWRVGWTERGAAMPASLCRDYSNLQRGVECLKFDWEPYF